MPGQPPGLPAFRGHDEDIHVAVIFAGEGDQRTVRREDGIGLHSRSGGQSLGSSSVAGDFPEVTRVGKDDVRPAEGRLLRQNRRIFRCGNQRNEE